MSEEKEFICTATGEPCKCDKNGCVTKLDPRDEVCCAFGLRTGCDCKETSGPDFCDSKEEEK
jgi:hypothetical protein